MIGIHETNDGRHPQFRGKDFFKQKTIISRTHLKTSSYPPYQHLKKLDLARAKFAIAAQLIVVVGYSGRTFFVLARILSREANQQKREFLPFPLGLKTRSGPITHSII